MWSHLRHSFLAYTLPGLALLLSLISCLLPLSSTHIVLDVPSPTATGAVLLLPLAYLTGHVAHGIASLLVRRCRAPEDVVLAGSGGASTLPAELVRTARDRMSRRVAVAPEQLNAVWLFRLCNIDVRNRLPLTEIPPYRSLESLHLGLSTAMLAAAAGGALMAVRGGAVLMFKGQPFVFTPLPLSLAAALLLSLTPLFFRSALRYGRLRVRHAVLAFLLLPDVTVPRSNLANATGALKTSGASREQDVLSSTGPAAGNTFCATTTL